MDAGRIPALPLYLDSPMAKGASEIYRAHPEAYDEETGALLRDHEAPLDYPGQHVVQNVQESQHIARSSPPYMIVASNGMLTGGRSVGHAERLLGDPSATVLFVGYQGEGTLGGAPRPGHRDRADRRPSRSRSRRRSARSTGSRPTPTSPRSSTGWATSSRAGEPGDPGVPKTVFLVHGDPPAQEALSPKVRSLGFGVQVPAWLETVSLD